MEDPLVSICCLAYNHEPYIRQCLDGFLMQRTMFSIEVLIHDDASTDRTSEIIREYEVKYPDIIKPIYQKENQYSKGIGVTHVFQFPRAKGKYIAMCEGDDYWIDPLKLQKQVDFLEDNPDYGLVHTDFYYVDIYNNEIPCPNEPLYTNLKQRIKNGYIWHYYIGNSGFILACATLYRKNLLTDENTYLDHGLFMSLARKSKVMYLDDKTSCYRINPNGAMRSNQVKVISSIQNAIFQQLLYFSQYGFNNKSHIFYYFNFYSRFCVSEGLVSALYHIKIITVPNKYIGLIKSLALRPISLLLFPFAFVEKIIKKWVHQSFWQ